VIRIYDIGQVALMRNDDDDDDDDDDDLSGLVDCGGLRQLLRLI